MNVPLPHAVRVVCLAVLSIVMGLAALFPAVAGAQEAATAANAAKDRAACMERFEIGFRYSVSDHRNEEYFRKYELFFNWTLPWAWRPASGWVLASRMDFTGAALRAAGTTGFLGSVGPSLAVRKKGWIIGIDLGISPAFLSEDRYGREDLSGHIQFLTHGGVTLFPIRHLSIGYAYQHISNANIQQPNPGLNMHNIEVSYRF